MKKFMSFILITTSLELRRNYEGYSAELDSSGLYDKVLNQTGHRESIKNATFLPKITKQGNSVLVSEANSINNSARTPPQSEDSVGADDPDFWKIKEQFSSKEQELHSLGLFLGLDHPAQFVATFNRQSKEAKRLATFAHAALAGSTALQKQLANGSTVSISRQNTERNVLAEQCPRRGVPQCPPASLRFRTVDGSCNNLRELWWGSAMSTMVRFVPAAYHDGIQEIRRSVNGHPLPSPRDVSNIIHEDRNVSLDTITHMLMQWGQFVDHDITATAQSTGFNGQFPQCCLNGGMGFLLPEFMHPDCLPIPVSPQDSYLGPLGVRCLEFVRSSPAPRENCAFGSREQLTQATSYLDASMVYGSSVEHSDNVRLFRHGWLQYGLLQAHQPASSLPETDSCRQGSVSTKCFKAGDGRLSEQPALMSLHIIFLRLHNGIATKLAAINAHWNDEKLYQEARRIVGALVQLITYREYLPIVLGHDITRIYDLQIEKEGYYKNYDPSINPTIENTFSTAAYRFGHSLVQKNFIRVDGQHELIFNNVTIHEEFSNQQNLHAPGSLDRLLLGLVNQPCQRRDEFITSELTNHLFQTPSFKFGMDLAAINIQRGRDHGIRTYAEWRSICGLTLIRHWIDFQRVTSASIARKFRKLYDSVEDIDLFSAGLAEKPVRGGLVGPTFACIIAQQFSNLRRGDRFWFENENQENSFTPLQLKQIKRVTLSQILCYTTDDVQTIQPFVFLAPDRLKNKRLSCDNNNFHQLNFHAWADIFPEHQIKHLTGNHQIYPGK
ncbi:peroxidase-like isoform X2 [Venturia canescens]|uniref:peroxidase-like isoform X2 n=1 Tax=Venturia canescens TaxID=32260 RepID=UPI001C9D10A2|nr:peroxidase-like isoform X2 [Venturia canescens]